MVPVTDKFTASGVTKVVMLAVLVLFIANGCGKSNPINSDIQNNSSTTVIGSADGGEPATEESSARRLPNEVLVVLQGQTNFGQLDMQTRPLELIKPIKCTWGTIYKLRITDGSSVESVVAELQADPNVRFAEPDLSLQFHEVPYFPNDPLWERDDDGTDPRDNAFDQWGPSKAGADLVWNTETGSEDIVVAVLDSGILPDHEDLENNLWHNEDEIPANGIDDDENGWIDDTWGWDFDDNDNNPIDESFLLNFHGTACAGVIAAESDNHVGLSGIAPGVKVMALKVSFGSDDGLVSSVCEALTYAQVNNADICSMSFGTTNGYSEILSIACDEAWDNGNGLILFASTGNQGDQYTSYPAGYESVIAVGASSAFDNEQNPMDEERISQDSGFMWGSNYGSYLELMGFGANYTTTYGGSPDLYWDGEAFPGFFTGTSCACPMSAGSLALLASFFPNQNAQWYRERLRNTADDLHGYGFDIYSGYGRSNLYRACYGPDRFEDLEDPDGFVALELSEEYIYDSIHDVPGNPFSDFSDLYKFSIDEEGWYGCEIDIFTWGEDLELKVFSDTDMMHIVDWSKGANHYNSSLENTVFYAYPGDQYYVNVYSAGLGNSTTYGIRTRPVDNILTVTGESIAPPFIHHGGENIPLLKLTFETTYIARLNQLIINKSGTMPNEHWKSLTLFADSNDNLQLDPADIVITTNTVNNMNRISLDGFEIKFDHSKPLVLFVASDIDSAPEGSGFRLSLESYKDVSTREGIEPPYNSFPISSELLQIGHDGDPPYWPATVGAVSAQGIEHGVLLGWNVAIDDLSEPVKYNIYYTTTLPFEITTATKLTDVAAQAGDTTDLAYSVPNLPAGLEHHFVVRATDQAGNEEENLEIVSEAPQSSGDPENPAVIQSFEVGSPYDIAISDSILLVADSIDGLKVFNRSNPSHLIEIGSWDGDYVVNGVWCDNQYAYVAGLYGLYVLDISDPSTPHCIDSVPLDDGRNVIKIGDWVYTACYGGEIVAVDATNPFILADYDPFMLPDNSWPFDLEYTNGILYVVFQNNQDSIASLDISDPPNISMPGRFGGGGNSGLFHSDGKLYVTGFSTDRLYIFDSSSDPVMPSLLGYTGAGSGQYPHDVVVRGDYAYMTKFDYGIVIFDVTNPSNPYVVGSLPLNGALSIATDGTYLYVAQNTGWLNVIL